ITGWSLVQGYGIKYAEIESNRYENNLGEQVTELPVQNGNVEGGASEYAYLLSWSDYNASPALYRLLDNEVLAKVAHKPFTANVSSGQKEFGYGSIVIPVHRQQISADSLYTLLQSIANELSVTFYSVNTGLNPRGIDLGSSNIQPVQKPEVALVIGDGVRSYE